MKIHSSDGYGRNLFHYACGFGTEKMVELLIRNSKMYGIDLNLKNTLGRTPFHLACKLGNIKQVEVMLENSREYNIEVFICA